ncbi:MAG: hypothetical protein PHT88_05535 [Candidatus Moranbacteria bacterium]|nr:hypothetical protein [Candidatus Moranbacteria bacterium]
MKEGYFESAKEAPIDEYVTSKSECPAEFLLRLHGIDTSKEKITIPLECGDKGDSIDFRYLGIGDIINQIGSLNALAVETGKDIAVYIDMDSFPSKYRSLINDMAKGCLSDVEYVLKKDERYAENGITPLEGESFEGDPSSRTLLRYSEGETAVTKALLLKNGIHFEKPKLIIVPNDKREKPHFTYAPEDWIALLKQVEKISDFQVVIMPHFSDTRRDEAIEKFCTDAQIDIVNLHEVFLRNQGFQEAQDAYGESRSELCSYRQFGCLAYVLGDDKSFFVSNDSAPIHLISASVKKDDRGVNLPKVISVNTLIPKRYCPHNGGIAFPSTENAPLTETSRVAKYLNGQIDE